MNHIELQDKLKELKFKEQELNKKLISLRKGEGLTIYNKDLYATSLQKVEDTFNQNDQLQDELTLKAFYLIFNDDKRSEKLKISWRVEPSAVLVDVVIQTQGVYKELFDIAYNRLEAWTYVDTSQALIDVSAHIKEYQFNENVSFYDFIEKVLPKINVKDLNKWQELCTKLYGRKNKRLFNTVIENSFDKTHNAELSKVCEYLFSKEGLTYLISDYTNFLISTNKGISFWHPNYSAIPLYKELPFIQQKLIEMYFKPMFLDEHLSLLLKLETAIHEAVPE